MGLTLKDIITKAMIGLAALPVAVKALTINASDLEAELQNSNATVKVNVLDDETYQGLRSNVFFINGQDTLKIQTDENGYGEHNNVPTPVEENPSIALPDKTGLLPNYPNPFNPSTTVVYELDRYSDVNLNIYNIKGQLVKTLVDSEKPAGRHEIRWDGTDNFGNPVAAGVYIKRLEAGGIVDSGKMTLLYGGISGGGGRAPRALGKSNLLSMGQQMVNGIWYDVLVTAEDYQDLHDSKHVEGDTTFTFYLAKIPENEAPTAVADVSPLEATVGDTISFTGINSYDTDGQIVNYIWDAGDGSDGYDTANAKHVFQEPGKYVVVLTVEDNNHATDSDTARVTINEIENIVQGLITAMFDTTTNNKVSGAIVNIGGLVDTTNALGTYSIAGLEPGNYIMTITATPDFHQRQQQLAIESGENYEDESIVPTDTTIFDMDFFDQVSGRNNPYIPKGTERWIQVPKLYIINGPLEGYSGFETPTQEEIDELILIWKDDIKELSKGFIDIPDSNIYIGHDVNDPIFKEAVKQIVNGAVLPDTTDGKRWDISLWTNMLPGSGDHGEIVEDGVIKGAAQRYRPGGSMRGLADIESAQSCGYPVDPGDNNDKYTKRDRYDYDNLRFTEKFLKCGEYNYSRPPNTMSPDISQ